LPDFKATFPKWKGAPLAEHAKGLDEIGLELLASLVSLDPNKRISSRLSLMHPYFDDLDKSKLPASSAYF